MFDTRNDLPRSIRTTVVKTDRYRWFLEAHLRARR